MVYTNRRTNSSLKAEPITRENLNRDLSMSPRRRGVSVSKLAQELEGIAMHFELGDKTGHVR